MKKYLFIVAASVSMTAMTATGSTIQLCGLPRPYTENDGNQLYVLFITISPGDAYTGANAYAPNLVQQWTWLTSIGGTHICVDYQLPIQSSINGLIKFSTGTPVHDSIKCLYHSQYNGSACTACPTGYVASIPSSDDYTPNLLTSLHFNTSCAYCDTGYYRSGSSCVKCPNSGRTENYNSSSIGNCYTYSGTNDQTGTYERQKCYYQ